MVPINNILGTRAFFSLARGEMFRGKRYAVTSSMRGHEPSLPIQHRWGRFSVKCPKWREVRREGCIRRLARALSGGHYKHLTRIGNLAHV